MLFFPAFFLGIKMLLFSFFGKDKQVMTVFDAYLIWAKCCSKSYGPFYDLKWLLGDSFTRNSTNE